MQVKLLTEREGQEATDTGFGTRDVGWLGAEKLCHQVIREKQSRGQTASLEPAPHCTGLVWRTRHILQPAYTLHTQRCLIHTTRHPGAAELQRGRRSHDTAFHTLGNIPNVSLHLILRQSHLITVTGPCFIDKLNEGLGLSDLLKVTALVSGGVCTEEVKLTLNPDCPL